MGRREADPPAVRRALGARRRLARLLLPRDFLGERGDEMEAAFEAVATDALRARGRAGLAVALVAEAADLARAGCTLRWHRWRRRNQGPAGERGMRRVLTSGLPRDARLAARTLLRRPGYAVLAVTTLALGVGGGTAIFTLVRDVVLDPLEYPDPDRVVNVFLTNPELGWERGPVSLPVFEEWRAGSGVFRALSAFQAGIRRTARIDGAMRLVEGTRVSGELFETLGVPPAEGRWIRPSDEGAGREVVVVLSDELRRQLLGDGPAVGRRVELGGEPHTVIGVMPPDFVPLHRTARFWVPFPWGPGELARDMSFLTVVGRLRDDVDREAARASVEALSRRMEAADPAGLAGRSVRIEPRAAVVTANVRAPLLLLLGALALLLLVAAANLAGLALARGADRRRELAVRRALGAGRVHLVRQLTLEAVVVAAVGAALALPVARLALDALMLAAPADLPRRSLVALDPRSMLFGLAVAGVLAAAFGVLPALLLAPRDVARGLREGRRGATGVSRLQRGLVVGQVALALVLVTGGGLLTTSLLRLGGVDRGFDGRGVLTFRLHPPDGAYGEPAELDAVYDRVVQALGGLPGVEAVGATWALPFGEMFGSSAYMLEGRPDGEEHMLQLVPVRGDYFGAMGIRPVRGRLFRPGDGEDGRAVTLVNESFAERAWPGRDPVGRRLRKGSGDEATYVEVVGVVPDQKLMSLGEAPLMQSFQPHAATPWARELYFTVSAEGEPLELVPAVRSAVARIDDRMPVADVATMGARLSEQLAGPRFRTVVVDAFAGLAAVLVLLGVYGVTALLVARRTREIGVRMALGAGRSSVLRGVLGDGVGLALRGAVIGLVVALLAARGLEGMLYGVEPLEPAVYAGATLAVVAVALLAAWVPARRAGRVDVVEVLKGE